jgi:DNA helicase-2/ATP-dependent DNA helicase PcrA
MENCNIIVGPPGTGKTTKLLSIVETLLTEGTEARDICFVAFTRKAASEAKHRAMEKFALLPDDLPWWSTLHSFAFRQLGINKNEVMGVKDYLAMAHRLGLYLTVKGIGEDGTISGLSKGDRLFFMEGQARATMTDLKAYWEARPDEDIYWYELEQVANTILKYKQIHSKLDFTDIIDKFVREGMVPDFSTLVVDEAQDLSPLQWRMVEKLAGNTKQVYIAGDDDQAIFRWAGADVEKFIGLDGFRIVLPQSYRVPKKVQEMADRVIGRIHNRIDKNWRPRSEEGEVHYVTDVEQVDMSKGTWLLLGRNSYVLEKYNEYCMRMGYVFDSSIGSPIRATSRRAIRYWETISQGGMITIENAKVMYDLMATRERVAYGMKRKLDAAAENFTVSFADLNRDFGLVAQARMTWDVALDKMPQEEREYFKAAMARGEQLTAEPRIRISTIHSVKGGEADHVVLQTDMAQRTFAEYQANPDDEHRVWYVGITRARQSLHIVQPQTDRAYEL